MRLRRNGMCPTRYVPEPRCMQEAEGHSAELPKLVSELRTVVGGYVAIATKVPTQEHRRGASFAQMGLSRAADAVTGKSCVPVLSLPVAPRPDGGYEGLPYVTKVLTNIRFVGGLHAPKCIEVVDSSGQVRAHLAHAMKRRFRVSAASSGAKMHLLRLRDASDLLPHVTAQDTAGTEGVHAWRARMHGPNASICCRGTSSW